MDCHERRDSSAGPADAVKVIETVEVSEPPEPLLKDAEVTVVTESGGRDRS